MSKRRVLRVLPTRTVPTSQQSPKIPATAVTMRITGLTLKPEGMFPNTALVLGRSVVVALWLVSQPSPAGHLICSARWLTGLSQGILDRFRVSGDHGKQDSRRTVRPRSALLPILKRGLMEPEFRRERGLA